MRKVYLFLTLPLILLIACNGSEPMPERPGNLEINFKLTYDGQPLVMNQSYTYPNPQDLNMNFSRVNLYLSSFFLDETKLADISFLDFTDFNLNEAAAEAGIRTTFENIEVGTYDKFSMGIGVPQDLNSTEPSDYEQGHPLARTSEYWAGWDSYIFAKYEGKVDTNFDNTLETGYTFHTGSDASYRTLEFEESIEILSNQTTEVTIIIDAQALFLNDTTYLDLSEIQGAHNQGDVDIMEAISDNYSAAFRLIP